MASRKVKKKISKDIKGDEKITKGKKIKDIEKTKQNKKGNNENGEKNNVLKESGIVNRDTMQKTKQGQVSKDKETKQDGENNNKQNHIKNFNKGKRTSNQSAKEKKNIEFGKFEMKKGDIYTGFYYTDWKGDIFRHGVGLYETSDGQTYDGIWYKDHLAPNEPVKITYGDGCKYEGGLQNYLYDGHGVYTFKNGARLACVFRKNKPIAKIELIDPNSNIWTGQMVNDRCILELPNIYYQDIDSKMGLPSYKFQFGEHGARLKFERSLSQGKSDRSWSKSSKRKSSSSMSSMRAKSSRWSSLSRM